MASPTHSSLHHLGWGLFLLWPLGPAPPAGPSSLHCFSSPVSLRPSRHLCSLPMVCKWLESNEPSTVAPQSKGHRCPLWGAHKGFSPLPPQPIHLQVEPAPPQPTNFPLVASLLPHPQDPPSTASVNNQLVRSRPCFPAYAVLRGLRGLPSDLRIRAVLGCSPWHPSTVPTAPAWPGASSTGTQLLLSGVSAQGPLLTPPHPLISRPLLPTVGF